MNGSSSPLFSFSLRHTPFFIFFVSLVKADLSNSNSMPSTSIIAAGATDHVHEQLIRMDVSILPSSYRPHLLPGIHRQTLLPGFSCLGVIREIAEHYHQRNPNRNLTRRQGRATRRPNRGLSDFKSDIPTAEAKDNRSLKALIAAIWEEEKTAALPSVVRDGRSPFTKRTWQMTTFPPPKEGHLLWQQSSFSSTALSR
uniref:Uncharacterized protein n=1 Tax=Odontella aurita TaxID=265563 RepID=A0A7S4IWG1_9STRA